EYVCAAGPPRLRASLNPLLLFCRVAYCCRRFACSGGRPLSSFRQSAKEILPVSYERAMPWMLLGICLIISLASAAACFEVLNADSRTVPDLPIFDSTVVVSRSRVPVRPRLPSFVATSVDDRPRRCISAIATLFGEARFRIVDASSWVPSRAEVPCWVRVASAPATCSNDTLLADAIGRTVDREEANSSIVILPSPAAVFMPFITRTESDALR